MRLTDALAALTLFAFVSSVTPGPNNLMLLSSGTRFGFRRTIPHMLGITIGFSAMIALVGLGLAQLFTRFPLLHSILKIASVAYLLLLAYKIAVAKPPSDEAGDRQGKPMHFLAAAAFQWVNPKAWTSALTALSAYMPPVDPWLGPLLVAGAFALVSIPATSIWAVMGMHLRRLLHDPARLRLFNRVAAALLVASLYPVVVGH